MLPAHPLRESWMGVVSSPGTFRPLSSGDLDDKMSSRIGKNVDMETVGSSTWRFEIVPVKEPALHGATGKPHLDVAGDGKSRSKIPALARRVKRRKIVLPDVVCDNRALETKGSNHGNVSRRK
jgi:hypothetical protein